MCSACPSATGSERRDGIFAMNSLAVLAAVHVIGGDLALAALSLQEFGNVEGRGKQLALQIGRAEFHADR